MYDSGNGSRDSELKAPIMSAILTNASAVVLAHDVNVSILKPPWLRKQDILTDEELSGNVVASGALTRVLNPRFEFLALPDRLQMRILKPEFGQADLLRVLGGIVSTLPHTPITAIGMNFDYVVSVEPQESFAEWNRSRFSSQFSLETSGEHKPDVRFGAFVSYEVSGMLLKADIKPCVARSEARSETSSNESEAMQVKCNFHEDLEESASTPVLLERLAHWDNFARVAEQFVDMLANGSQRENR